MPLRRQPEAIKRGKGRLIGRKKGGLNSKLHALTDGFGRPLGLILSAGNTRDYTGAAALLPSITERMQKHDQGDLLRSIAEAVLQPMIENDVDGLIGAGRHERSGKRTTWRNGYRITSRQVVRLFPEQFRLEFVPALHRLQGRLAAQG